MLNSYLRSYRIRILPLFPSIFVPEAVLNSAPTLQRSYVLYAIFAHGAQEHAHKNEAAELFSRAREAAKELFLSTDTETLNGHLLMAFYHFACGELEAMTSFLALALQTCRDDALLPVHQQALTLKLYATPSAVERDLILTRLLSQQLHPREMVMALLASVYADVRFQRAQEEHVLASRLTDADRLAQQLTDAPSVQVAAQCLLHGLRAVLLQRQRPDMAAEQAALNTELSRQYLFREEGSPFCVLGLELSAPVNMHMNPPLGQEDLHTLNLYRNVFPFSELALARLTPPMRPVPTLFDVPALLAHAPPEMPLPHFLAAAAPAPAAPPAAMAVSTPAPPPQAFVAPRMVHIKTEDETAADDIFSTDLWSMGEGGDLSCAPTEDWANVGPSSAPASFLMPPPQQTRRPLRAVPAHIFVSETGGKPT